MSMVLSFALHGAVLLLLIAAGAPGTALTDEPAFMVEVALAAPAPSQETAEASAEAPTPPSPPEVTEQAVAEPTPPSPPEVTEQAVVEPTPPTPSETTQDVVETETPPPPPPEPEIAIDLPPPDEPPPVKTAEVKPPEPKPDPPKPKPPPAKPAAAKPAAAKPAVTQTVSPPDTGTNQTTQQAAALPAPLIVWEDRPRFRSPPKPAPYPPRAIELNQQGEARVRVRLEPDGSAAEILLHRSTGFDILDRAALAAVRGWSFMPAMRDGRAVAAWVEIPVRFHLR